MEIVHDSEQLDTYISEAVVVSGTSPVLLDSYLRDAIEVDVDCLADGKDVFVCGVMEHIEEAGVHSGDSACSLPPHSLRGGNYRRVEAPDRGTCARPQCDRADECAIRHQGWRNIRPGSQSAGRAVRSPSSPR